MDVRVALVAAEAAYVQAIGFNHALDGPADAVHALLEREVFVRREAAQRVDAMFERRDERVAEERRRHREEGDAEVVSEHDVVIVAFAAHDLANEARAALNSAYVGVDVERHAGKRHGDGFLPGREPARCPGEQQPGAGPVATSGEPGPGGDDRPLKGTR